MGIGYARRWENQGDFEGRISDKREKNSMIPNCERKLWKFLWSRKRGPNYDSRDRCGMMRNEGGRSDRDQNLKERVLESY